MHTTNLRKVGGSVMLTVPPAFLEQLKLSAGATVGLAVEQGRLVVKPQSKPHYTLTELLAVSDYENLPTDAETCDWLDAPAVGKEIL